MRPNEQQPKDQLKKAQDAKKAAEADALAEGVGEGLATEGFATGTSTPLSQTNFFPLFTQV